MSLLGNLVFFVFGGFIIFLGYVLGGIILPGLELAIMHLLLGALFAITIVGFPLAVQHMKLVKVALLPFGHVMRRSGGAASG